MRLALRTIKGKTRDEVEAIGKEIYNSALQAQIAEAGRAAIKARTAEGCTVVVLSGAFDFLLAPFCNAEGLDCWRCTRLSYREERCTGRLDGAEHLGHVKKRYVQELFKGQDIDWQGSWVYSDELTDLPLFSLVGNKYFVVHGGNLPPELPDAFRIVNW